MMATAIHLGGSSIANRTTRDTVTHQRRRITPDAGRALEILGHAIEYLTDEYVKETKEISAADPQVSAIRLLMSLNRQVYFECPVVPTLRERVRAWRQGRNLHRRSCKRPYSID